MLSESGIELAKSLTKANPSVGIRMLAKMMVNPLVSVDFDEAIKDIYQLRELLTKDQFTLFLKQIITTLTKRSHVDVREKFKDVFKKEYKL
jgi:hypothetical protein